MGKRQRRRPASNVIPRVTGILGLSRAWAPVAALAVATILVAQVTGPGFAVFTVAVVVAAAAFTYWRRRLNRADHHIPWTDILLQVWRAWFLTASWPRACGHARLGRTYRGVTPRLGRVRLHDDGTITARVNAGRYGVTVDQLRARSGELAEYVGAYELGVKDHRGGKRGRAAKWFRSSGVVTLTWYFEDALGRVMRLRELPVSAEGTVCFGRQQNRAAATIAADTSLLIFGMTGSGKSNIVWTMLADLIRRGVPTRLYVSDPKGGMELGALGDRLGDGSPLFSVRRYATTPTETTDMIDSLTGAMQKRQRVMKGRGQRKHVPTVDDPLVIFLCDEFLALSEQLRKGADSPLGTLLYQGRASGYLAWGLAQVPDKDTIGVLRSLIPQRIALRLDAPSSNVPALGRSAPAHEIDAPGVGYVVLEGQGGTPVKFRAPLVTDIEVAMIARGVVPDMPGDEVQDPCRVYRAHGVLPAEDYPALAGEERLLYVGKARDFEARRRQHEDPEDGSQWVQWVTRWETEEWPNEKRALAAERAAIVAEQPVFNKHHNTGNPLRRVARRARERVAA